MQWCVAQHAKLVCDDLAAGIIGVETINGDPPSWVGAMLALPWAMHCSSVAWQPKSFSSTTSALAPRKTEVARVGAQQFTFTTAANNKGSPKAPRGHCNFESAD